MLKSERKKKSYNHLFSLIIIRVTLDLLPFLGTLDTSPLLGTTHLTLTHTPKGNVV